MTNATQNKYYFTQILYIPLICMNMKGIKERHKGQEKRHRKSVEKKSIFWAQNKKKNIQIWLRCAKTTTKLGKNKSHKKQHSHIHTLSEKKGERVKTEAAIMTEKKTHTQERTRATTMASTGNSHTYTCPHTQEYK